MKKSIICSALLVVLLVGCFASIANSQPSIPEIPQVTVRFSNSPYIDHSYASIGVKKGFFEDVGITLDPPPYGRVIPAEQMASVLIANTVDVTAIYTPSLIPSLKQTTGLKTFVYGNAFMGFAIMGDAKYKSFKDLIAEGLSPDEAIKAVAEQMRGKTFAYPAETGPKAFMELVFEKAGMTLQDVNAIIVDDPKGVEMMVSGRADFHVGGAPAHFSLLKKGFKEIVTNEDLVKYAKPSPESKELLAIGHAGWASTEKWYLENHETALRVASVLYRIMRFMKDHETEALEAQLPYANSIAGTDFSVEDGRILYKLNGFTTFEDQASWFLNPENPLYYKWNLEANIKMWEDNGTLEKGKYTADDVSAACQTYKELLDLKEKSSKKINEVKDALLRANADQENIKKATELLNKSEYLFDAYDFLDAERFASAAEEWANYTE